jgi:hypothetical protein
MRDSAEVVGSRSRFAITGACRSRNGPLYPGAASATPEVTASQGLIDRIKNILLRPKSEWSVIAAESTSTGKLYVGYAIPLAAFAAVVSIVHMSVIGVSLPFAGSIRTPFPIALPYMVMSFVFGLVGLFIEALIINGLASTFSGQRPAGDAVAARDQGAAAVGSVIGGLLGTDDKGKAGLSAALSNIAKVGEQAESQQSAAANAAPSFAPAASQDNAQNAGAAVGGLLTAPGGALGGSHRVDPVSFQTLRSLLPTGLPGMRRTDAQGSEQQAIGVKSSSASGEYQGSQGDRVEIKIADMSGVAGLMDLADALNQNTHSESDTGYERDAIISGRTVHEKYDNKSRHGELNIIVAKRFEVDVTGDAVDMSALEQDLSSVDLVRLESMKDVGAQAR